MTTIKKVAILRPSALGDLVVALPALEAIRAAYPGAEIVYLGRPWHKKFFQERPLVDRVEVVPQYPGVGEDVSCVPDLRAVDDFFERMRGEAFDLALQMYGGGEHSNPFLLMLEAKQTAGFCSRGAQPLDLVMPHVYLQNETVRCLELTTLLGAKATTYSPRIRATPAEKREASLVYRQSRPFAIIHPGASDLRRRWHPEGFSRVADALAARGLDVCITGVEQEHAIASAVTSGMNFPAENLAGKLSLGALIGLISNASILVANDTGPLHLAHALQTPSVGLYAAGSVGPWAPLERTANAVVVARTMDCPRCGMRFTLTEPMRARADCDHSFSFVRDITEDAVIAAVDEMLQRGETARAPDEHDTMTECTSAGIQKPQKTR